MSVQNNSEKVGSVIPRKQVAGVAPSPIARKCLVIHEFFPGYFCLQSLYSFHCSEESRGQSVTEGCRLQRGEEMETKSGPFLLVL